ncbi:helix-turn-helix domain-containing protein [Streptomyces sp. NPDC056061]|uniref:helix-turn-helix domain-containing protein n=1 Tax=Streptomyces sp. NPDC056061 TaxID=3345700 RepID=UPI0035D7D5D2
MTTESGTYDSFDDFLDEFFPDDSAARERIERGAEALAAEERGVRLVELRERARATREDVALRMGVELQRVIDLETGATGFDFHRIDELTRTDADEADEELRDLARYITELSSYIRAVGGDVQLEVSGATLEVADPVTGARTTSTGPLFVPAPADSFTPDLIFAVLRKKPARLIIWAEVEGWRTDIAA